MQTKEMQEQCFEVSRTTNADVQRKLKNKYDTRAAAAVENITKQGAYTNKCALIDLFSSIFLDNLIYLLTCLSNYLISSI